MLKQLAMEITALVCLPCSDVFLSAESLWQNWLEFANMFELPWNIIYGSTWHFLKYDMMMIRVIITAVIAQVTLPVFSYFFFCITFLHLPFTYLLHIILYTFFYLFCFVLSTAKVMVPSWFIYPQVHRLLFILPGLNPSQCYSSFLRCDANEIK